MRLGLLWILAAVAGTLGATVLYDALPGINWSAWTLVAIAGLLIYRRPDRPTLRMLALPLAFAVVLAAGIAVTTTPILVAAVALITASLMALAVLVANEHAADENYGPLEILTAPFRALARTLQGIVSAGLATVESVGAVRQRPVLRGALIATPVVLVLALLFATADPVLARGRDAIYDVLSAWTALPRVVFGLAVTIFVLGAYAATHVRASLMVRQAAAPDQPLRIGLTERRIVLSAAAAVSWLFVLLQLSYLFGASPAVVGSGVTFAQYAHRGFGELTIAATLSALLIIAANQNVRIRADAAVRRAITWPALALLAAVACILVSAFHRITLYENAYGYTTARIYVQAYLLLALAVLFVLTWHVARDFDVRRLARQVMTVALATLTFLVFWNGDAWVAQANLARYAETGKIDIPYLTNELSLDAYPTLVQALPSVAEPERAQLALALTKEYATHDGLRRDSPWYAWNLRRARARSFVVVSHPPNIPRPL